MTITLVLTEDELHTLINALGTAAEKYRECAATMREEWKARPNTAASLGLQFDRQAHQCTALIEKMES